LYRISLFYKVLRKAGDWMSHLAQDGLIKSESEKSWENGQT